MTLDRSTIPSPDQAAADAARHRQDMLTKPQGALGRLEDVAMWFAARQGRAIPLALCPAITVFAADHGVTAQGVSAYPSVVTAEMVKNFARGGAAINVLARRARARLTIVDVGIASALDALPGLVSARVRAGTADLTIGPAMTRPEAAAALAIGADRARIDIASGANVLIAGEMGIGNTTAAAALICALAGGAPANIVDAGSGLDAAGVARKSEVVARALGRAHAADPSDAIAWLAELGGLEIGAIAGYYLAAAAGGVPILLDGFITAAAALVAARIDPAVTRWMLATHRSVERGHVHALAALGLDPLFDLGMRLGEASGAAVALPLIDAALALHAEMATFAEAGVSSA